jgi:hypothetical protein
MKDEQEKEKEKMSILRNVMSTYQEIQMLHKNKNLFNIKPKPKPINHFPSLSYYSISIP